MQDNINCREDNRRVFSTDTRFGDGCVDRRCLYPRADLTGVRVFVASVAFASVVFRMGLGAESHCPVHPKTFK